MAAATAPTARTAITARHWSRVWLRLLAQSLENMRFRSVAVVRGVGVISSLFRQVCGADRNEFNVEGAEGRLNVLGPGDRRRDIGRMPRRSFETGKRPLTPAPRTQPRIRTLTLIFMAKPVSDTCRTFVGYPSGKPGQRGLVN